MAAIRGYLGISLDAYIAGPGGSLDWLTKYGGADFGEHGYDQFIAGIRTVVMGRGTYDEIAGFGVGWPYQGKRAIVVTSRPIDKPLGPIAVWTQGVAALIEHLRELDDGDVWIVGGGLLQQAMIAGGGLDRLELFVMPEIIGSGVPLFPPNGFQRSVTLAAADRLGAGVVRLLYEFPAAA